jgi:tetratricopeptide (TPR) repeat protein
MNRLKQLAQNIRNNPDDSFSKFALALEFIKLGNNHDALSLFKNIEKNDPDYVGLYYHLGKLYISIGENQKALEAYNKGIEVAGRLNDAHARNELQAALFELESELE